PAEAVSGNGLPDDQPEFGLRRIGSVDVQVRDCANLTVHSFQYECRVAHRIEFAHFVFDERGQFAQLVQETQLDFFRRQPPERAAQRVEVAGLQRTQQEFAAV